LYTLTAPRAKEHFMGRLRGKVAVVTGGNSGIGLAIATRFAEEGAHVFISGRRKAQLQQAAASIGPHVEPIAGDLTLSSGIEQLFAAVEKSKGRVDILVASAGIAEPSRLDAVDSLHFERHFNINVRAALFSVQAATRLMSRGGAVVLIGSIAGFIGTPAYGVYGATKAAIRAFSRTWTNELAARGIRVNTLSPGPIDTPMFDGASEEVRASLSQQIPLGRLGRPEEVAAAALFLASDESSFVAGAELCIDGGMGQV
jgi:NAD(P)-dependent dehydrogenase (short-subunit alcohol dehydrogenase family)